MNEVTLAPAHQAGALDQIRWEAERLDREGRPPTGRVFYVDRDWVDRANRELQSLGLPQMQWPPEAQNVVIEGMAIRSLGNQVTTTTRQ